jgi:sugar/nucleoside kinase (ribokinase family)
MKDFNIHTIGKKYKDQIYVLDELIIGETNKYRHKYDRLGGHYNIDCNMISNCNIIRHDIGESVSIILEEKNKARRTSVVNDIDCEFETLNEHVIERGSWAHFCYVDDMHESHYKKINAKYISVDFCTLTDRRAYLDIMKRASLIFDSRERKFLYSNINIETAIILHDQEGCECIIGGDLIYKYSQQSLPNLNVNGAGDMFAAIFIDAYLTYSLQEAINKSCKLTTGWLKNEKKI